MSDLLWFGCGAPKESISGSAEIVGLIIAAPERKLFVMQ
jgi:hypothetical protein